MVIHGDAFFEIDTCLAQHLKSSSFFMIVGCKFMSSGLCYIWPTIAGQNGLLIAEKIIVRKPQLATLSLKTILMHEPF